MFPQRPCGRPALESPRMSHEGNEWVTIYRSGREDDCRDRALVLQAMGTPYQVRWEANEFIIAVAATNVASSRAELEAYTTENRDGRSDLHGTRPRADGWNGVLGFIAVLAVMAVFQRHDAFGVDWFAHGKTHAGLIRQGEWWRVVTALTLHTDLLHILSNLVIGGLVGLFAGRSFGSGFAWLCILVGGGFGNLLNAWLRPAEHTSVGASTAVFAALGLLSGHAWRQRRRFHASGMERWAPLVGGLLLLGYLGAGGGRTDVPAHVFGFLSGTVLGTVFGKTGAAWQQRSIQILAGSAAMIMVVLAWAVALTPG